MDPRNRPTALVVLGILNLVLGALGIVGGLCGAASLAILPALGSAIPTPPQGPNPFNEISRMYDGIPGFYWISAFQIVVQVALAILLLVAGIGLLQMKPWSRSACFIYAAAMIVVTLLGTAFTAILVTPAVQKWSVEFQEKMRAQAGGQPVPAVPFMMNGPTSTFMTAMSSLLWLAYPIALFIVLTRPSIKQVFNRPGSRSPGSPSDENLGIEDRTEILGEARAWDPDEDEPRRRPKP